MACSTFPSMLTHLKVSPPLLDRNQNINLAVRKVRPLSLGTHKVSHIECCMDYTGGRPEYYVDRSYFPRFFLFGASSSAVQTEGAPNMDGKGPSMWDHYIQTKPDKIYGGENIDMACDSYHKFKDDIAMLKRMGATSYRFSIAWTRILPKDHTIVQAMTEIITWLQGDIPHGSRKGVPYVNGKTKVAAYAKHFVGDGGTTKGINETNTVINYYELLNIHMPAYNISIIKGVSTVMISYTSLNGQQMHANHDLVPFFFKEKHRVRGFVREAVRKQLVLLKNGESADTPVLPLPKKAPKILVAEKKFSTIIKEHMIVDVEAVTQSVSVSIECTVVTDPGRKKGNARAAGMFSDERSRMLLPSDENRSRAKRSRMENTGHINPWVIPFGLLYTIISISDIGRSGTTMNPSNKLSGRQRLGRILILETGQNWNVIGDGITSSGRLIKQQDVLQNITEVRGITIRGNTIRGITIQGNTFRGIFGSVRGNTIRGVFCLIQANTFRGTNFLCYWWFNPRHYTILPLNPRHYRDTQVLGSLSKFTIRTGEEFSVVTKGQDTSDKVLGHKSGPVQFLIEGVTKLWYSSSLPSSGYGKDSSQLIFHKGYEKQDFGRRTSIVQQI